ncbi:CBS domain-containing protein [Streptomyces sp. NPDC019396]|uniref:CBS domain-containing protein n=1 Tax=Streptomyces sp. NPDC019396 TaxID=3154687 RepID=UPI0033FBC3B1
MKHDRVGTVMTSEVVRARSDTTFREIVQAFDQYRISGLPVVDDDDKVIGVLSETDLLTRAMETENQQQTAHRLSWPWRTRRGQTVDAGIQKLNADQLMTHPAITVHAEESIALAARTLAEHHVERLPVVDEEERLVGIVTRRDLLQVFLRPDREIHGIIVHDILDRTLWLPPGTLVVDVREGTVTLSGELEYRSETLLVVRLVELTDGVVDVIDHLTYRVDNTRRPNLESSAPLAVGDHQTPET